MTPYGRPMEKPEQKNIESVVDDLMDQKRKPVAADVDCVLELLAITMFADKQVLASEIQAFVEIVLRLQRDNTLSTNMSEAKIILWYELHKEELTRVMQHDVFESWIEERIHKLRDFPDKHLLLRAIDEIAIADGEKHISEKALHVLTARKWADALLELYAQNRPILAESVS